jgi:uncharacterized RDD family membrane protein YckC
MMICKNHPSVHAGVTRCWRCMKPVCENCRITLNGKAYCADCKRETVADIRSGVSMEAMELAGIGRRWLALIIDSIVIGAPIWIVLVVLVVAGATGGEPSEPPAFLNYIGFLFIPVYIAYEGLMLAARGQTVGKIALKIKVVRPSGEEISTGQAWGRSVMRSIFVSFLSLINYLPALFTREKTCVHDMAAKTRVIRVH